jgi:hypothetical protein
MDGLFIFGKHLGNKNNTQEPWEICGILKLISWFNQKESKEL